MICARVQAGAARAAHRQDEGKAELRVVVGVELLDAARTPRGVQLVRPALLCSLVDSAVRLLLTIALPASSGWARIRASCLSRPAPAHDPRHRVLQVRERAEGPLRQRALARSRASARRCRRAARRPRPARGGVELFDGECHVSLLRGRGGLASSAARCRRGGRPRRGRAAAMWSRKRCSARDAPGRPSRRQCMPMLIIFGASSPSA